MRRVRDEIRNYPGPIPACDAQFNHLLEEREALTSEIGRVRDLMAGEPGSRDVAVAIDEYLTVTTCLSDAAKDEIRGFVENDDK